MISVLKNICGAKPLKSIEPSSNSQFTDAYNDLNLQHVLHSCMYIKMLPKWRKKQCLLPAAFNSEHSGIQPNDCGQEVTATVSATKGFHSLH